LGDEAALAGDCQLCGDLPRLNTPDVLAARPRRHVEWLAAEPYGRKVRHRMTFGACQVARPTPFHKGIRTSNDPVVQLGAKLLQSDMKQADDVAA
jgi:hypothetical protein